MIIGTTPIFTLRLKKNIDVDLTHVNNIYVTIKQGNVLLNKKGQELTIVDSKTVKFTFTQAESLSLDISKPAELQLNWTFVTSNGVLQRAATKVITFDLEKQLLKEELT